MFSIENYETAIFCNFHCASDDIILKFLWSKLNFLQEKQTSIWTKSHSTLVYCNFLNREHTQLPNLQQTQCVINTLRRFQTNRKNRLFVVWVRVTQGQIYISLQSNEAEICSYSSYGDKSAIFSSSSLLLYPEYGKLFCIGFYVVLV